MAKLIVEHVKPVPIIILRLVYGIITDHRETRGVDAVQANSRRNPNPDLERRKNRHRYWIEGLEEAFSALVGDVWLSA